MRAPFFVAAGLHKPHLPFYFPAEFGQLYPPASAIAPPARATPPDGMPAVAWHTSRGAFNNSWSRPCPAQLASVYRRAYYSAVSYADSSVGAMLSELDALRLAASTAVVLFGDHGWHLGESNLWQKMTNFELGVRVPLIVRAPWKRAAVGVRSARIVELVSLYRTLAELLELPRPEDGVDGTSFADVFDGAADRAQFAFSQFSKKNVTVGRRTGPWGDCARCAPSEIEVMGLSVRDDRWRYTEWIPWDATALRPRWAAPTVGIELYDHKGDFGADLDAAAPDVNLAYVARHEATRRALSGVLRAHFRRH